VGDFIQSRRTPVAGHTVRIAIIAETIQNTIVVPAAAILNFDEGGQKVMVVDGKSIAHDAKLHWGTAGRPGADCQRPAAGRTSGNERRLGSKTT